MRTNRAQGDGRYYDGRWPEDEFERHRNGRYLRDDDPQPYRHDGGHRSHYPPDYHDHGYGQNIRSYNGNRRGPNAWRNGR